MNIILGFFTLSLIVVFFFLTKQKNSQNQESFDRMISTAKEINKVVKPDTNRSSLYAEWKTKYYFFTKAELFFYRELVKYTAQKNALVLSKVRIADLVEPKHRLNNSEFNKTFRRITQKHVDYVITDFSGRICCVLELDGNSHTYGKTLENDKFKNEFFESIGLRLVRFQNYGAHNLSQLDNLIG